jgi:uncharacterized membrane protein
MSKSTVAAAVLVGAVAAALASLATAAPLTKARSRRGHSRRQAEMLWRRLEGAE